MRRLQRNFHQHEHPHLRQPPDILLIPAYMTMPILRWPLGYEITYPTHGFWPLVLITLVPPVYWLFYMAFANREPPPNVNHGWLVAFALACFVVQCAVFVKRAWGIRHGEQVHTREVGYSFLTWRTELPVWLCEQILIPLGLGAAGWYLRPYSLELGWWLIWCSFSYLLMARWEVGMRLAATSEYINTTIRAETFEERVDEHRRQRQAYSARRKGRGGQRPAYGQYYGDEPDEAAAGPRRKSARNEWRSNRDDPPRSGQDEDEDIAQGPDVAAWSRDSDSASPDYSGWFRRKKGKKPRNGVPAERDE